MSRKLKLRILTALNEAVNADDFERCGVEMVSPFYPGARLIRGGDDAGLDGVAHDEDGQVGIVTTTSQEATKNLRRNLRSHVASGGKRRRVVFVTHRHLSGRRQQNLTKLAQEEGFTLIEVFDQEAAAEFFYRHPDWRKQVLGIADTAPALALYPQTERIALPVPLIERDSVLDELRSATGDVLLVGKPGVGKTAVLRQLASEEWGLFDVGESRERVADAILETQPRRILVEDAHLNPDRLAQLRQLRTETGASFALVATTWPGGRAELAMTLGDARVFELEDLSRVHIGELIRQIGIQGPNELMRLLVDQSRGRPGLATTLALACVSGRVDKAASGRTLLEDTLRWYSRVLGGYEIRTALGVMALSGNRGASLDEIASALGVSRAKVSELLRRFAEGGLIDVGNRFVFERDEDYLSVQPEMLRYSLVEDVFFGSGALPLRETIDVLGSPPECLPPLISAIYRRHKVPTDLLLQVGKGDASCEAVEGLAAVRPDLVNTLVDSNPSHRVPLLKGLLRVDLKRGLLALMEAAVGDERVLHNSPDHPLRAVEQYLRHPGTPVAERRIAVDMALAWLAEGREEPVGLSIVASALTPGVEAVEQAPVEKHSIVIKTGLLPFPALRDLAEVWKTVADSLPSLALADLAPILEALHPWVFPHDSVPNVSTPEESAVLLLETAKSTMRSLAQTIDRPGFQVALIEKAHHAGFEIEVEIDPFFEALYPADRSGRDAENYETWDAVATEKVRELANGYMQVEPRALAERLKHVEDEARAAGLNRLRFTQKFVDVIANRADLREITLAFAEYELPPDLLVLVSEKIAARKPEAWEPFLLELFRMDLYRFGLVAVLLKTDSEQLKQAALAEVSEVHRTLIEVLLFRGELDEPTIQDLLRHEPAVAAVTAGHLRGDKLADLSDETRRLRREALLPASILDSWVLEALKTDSDLLHDWLLRWFQDLGSRSGVFFPDDVLDAIRTLPDDVRGDLIESLAAAKDIWLAAAVVSALVGDDVATAHRLLAREDLRSVHGAALTGVPTEAWAAKALVALDAGWSLEEVVQAVLPRSSWFWGPESAYRQQFLDGFNSLETEGDLRLQSLVEEANRQWGPQIQEMKAREKNEEL